MKIVDTIESIKEKYELNNKTGSFQEEIFQKVVQILEDIPKDKVVGIKGRGEHTHRLLSLAGNKFTPDYIFDRCAEIPEKCTYDNRTFHVYPDSEIANKKIDIIIISSFSHRNEMKEELKGYAGKFEILDLYDELHTRGIDINAMFYRATEDSYENVLYRRKQYFEKKTPETLNDVIVAYLEIRDFINYYKYSEEYVLKKYDGYEKISEAMLAIKEMFGKVRERLKERKQRDIITIWNDQVGYSELPYTGYLKEMSRESFFFENAYSMTPFTVPTFYEIFQHMTPLDDAIYHKQIPLFDADNTEIIRNCEHHGYDFVYIGDSYDAGLFQEKYAIGHYVYNSSCIRCLDLLQVLLDSEKPVFCILHALTETHNPYLSGELENAKWYEWPKFMGDTEEEVMKQMRISLAYWEKQLEFYMNMMPDNCVKIFMSDHGKRFNYQPIYKEPTTHIIFYIVGKGVPSKRIKKLYSIYDFDKLIDCVLNQNFDEDKMCRECINLQETNIFNRTAISYYVENHAEENTSAFRAVRTEHELYVKLSTGKKYYFLLPDEETNRYEDKYMQRISELDLLAGDKFEDSREFEKELARFRNRFESHE